MRDLQAMIINQNKSRILKLDENEVIIPMNVTCTGLVDLFHYPFAVTVVNVESFPVCGLTEHAMSFTAQSSFFVHSEGLTLDAHLVTRLEFVGPCFTEVSCVTVAVGFYDLVMTAVCWPLRNFIAEPREKIFPDVLVGVVLFVCSEYSKRCW